MTETCRASMDQDGLPPLRCERPPHVMSPTIKKSWHRHGEFTWSDLTEGARPTYAVDESHDELRILRYHLKGGACLDAVVPRDKAEKAAEELRGAWDKGTRLYGVGYMPPMTSGATWWAADLSEVAAVSVIHPDTPKGREIMAMAGARS